MSIQKTDHVARATAAWGDPLPDWIEVLAKACMASSQKVVARKIGMSDAVVSQTIGRSYAGDMAGVEARVRGALMGNAVECPATRGPMPLNVCADWQRHAQRWMPGNPTRTAMYRACRRCPRFNEEDAPT